MKEVEETVKKINDLLSQLRDIPINVLDEEGNDTYLRLDVFSCDNDSENAKKINIWCHQVQLLGEIDETVNYI